MSEPIELTASARETAGTSGARAVRRDGKVPGIIYGGGEAPLAVSLPYKDIDLRIHHGNFLTTVLTVNVDGNQIRVIPRDYQLDPVQDFPLHVDFLHISSVTLPDRVKPTIQDRDFTIATIAAPAGLKEEAEEAAEAAEAEEAAEGEAAPAGEEAAEAEKKTEEE
jgi:ribosomal protein L25 (general stress protein Ctc)